MFQYAAVKGIAKNMGYDFVIPNHSEAVEDNLGNILRTELFDSFDIECEIGIINNQNYVGEKHFHFDEDIFNRCPDNVSLHGFYQTEKYFKHIEDEIRHDFTFKEDILEPCKEMIGDETYNSLHVRRTDYIKNSKSHTNLNARYYSDALAGFDKSSKFIVFSDDPEWCKKQQLFSDDRFLISENTDNRIDLCLMTLCKGHIIANSSFSWWGAWLANSKTVVAPKDWFGVKLQHQETKDLYCKEWVVL